jgi:hypothetical protein
MFNQANLSITIQVLTLLGIAWAIYASLKKPQEESITNDKVFEEKFTALSARFDTRFQDMKDGVVKVMQNDLQEVKQGLKDHVTNQGIYERDMAEKYGRFDAKLDVLINK